MNDELTQNVQPLLHEICHALQHLLTTGESHIIDLRSIPLAPSEEEVILDRLGQGEVQAQLNALGISKIYETQYAGVWLVSHYNAHNELLSRFIEITELPDILKSPTEDMADALQRLKQHINLT